MDTVLQVHKVTGEAASSDPAIAPAGDLDCDDEERNRQSSSEDAGSTGATFLSSPSTSVSSSRNAKRDVVATLLKMDHFADRLASIRSDIAARQSGSTAVPPSRQQQSDRQDGHLPRAYTSTAPHTETAAASTSSPRALASQSFEHLKLPLIKLIASNNESAARPLDSFLSIEAVQERAALQRKYTSDADRLAEAEQVAADALQHADRLAEESRIAMVVYTQNERSWSFDERATRYERVVEARKLAEVARVHADDYKAAAQLLRSRLVNPYRTLQAAGVKRPQRKRGVLPLSPRSDVTRLSTNVIEAHAHTAMGAANTARTSEEFVYVWLLAAPSTNLSFTPREATVSTILAAEKELSTHVVYYVAASALNEESSGDNLSENNDRALTEDSPPQTGWISCSMHGVTSVPEVRSVKSSIETWLVSGAGVGHLNGKYILNGVHDSARTFKSSAGVELFRKRIPIASSLAQGLHDAPVAKQTGRDVDTPDTAASSRIGGMETDSEASVSSAAPLPSALKAIESDERSFRSMSRIGSWLGSNEMKEKYRRRRESEALTKGSKNDANSNHDTRAPEDGDHVRTQDAKMRLESSIDLQVSRPEANAVLCREWVLFMSCSRRHVTPEAGASAPPKQNSGLGCLKRHYYISVEEKETMTIWAQEEEARLEQSVLQNIIRREEQIARVRRLCSKCMSKFQQSLAQDTERIAHTILLELNTVRFLSVKVLEQIERWRAHARRLGFARFDAHHLDTSDHGSADKKATERSSATADGNSTAANSRTSEPALLGWSASITISTGRQLFKGSNAFVSKVKRFCRAEDAVGKKEQHIVYLGYFATRMEAERAYEEYATAEARRLNTTAAHLPRHRNVFRSCGKHFAVESERLGPSVCIECKVKQLASLATGGGADEWMPPFFYMPGENYILKMGNDLDFLDDVPPITSLLNDGRGSDDPVFPILGNVFLLPKTPIQDPTLVMFATCGLTRAPRLGVTLEKEKRDQEIADETTLDRERILAVQKIFLQELQMYQPDLFPESGSKLPTAALDLDGSLKGGDASLDASYRLVDALYWDRCAALRIQQRREPLAFRQQGVWCRPDAGEWASLAVRGKNQLHFQFELKLAAAGKETQEKRKLVLKALRRLLKTPLYWIPSREHITRLIADGAAIKGDVVVLEMKSVTKYLEKYDSWCAKALVVQRWYRGARGRQRARSRRAALHFVCQFRLCVAQQVARLARSFYEKDVVPSAMRRAIRAISRPEFTAALKLNGESVVVSFHSLRHFNPEADRVTESFQTSSHKVVRSVCCAGCAKRFHVRAEYKLAAGRFEVSSGGVCCCSLNGGSRSASDSESWFVRAYNPINNTTYRMKIENSLIRQLMSSLQPPQFGRRREPSKSATASCHVQPVALKWVTHERAVVASIQTNYWRSQCDLASQELQNWRLLSSEATQRRKTAVLRRDRTAMALASLRQSYSQSIDSAKAALDFTSRQFHEAQAWDPLENANDWKLLVHKRHLQKELEATESELDRCRLEVFRSTYDEQFLKTRVGQVQARYERDWVPLIRRETQRMESASTLETSAKAVVDRLMQEICRQVLTLRDGFFLPTRRHLVLQSRMWKERSGIRIAVPGLLRTRNIMRRRVLLLTNDEKLPRRRSERMIVSVGVSASPSVDGTARSSTSSDVWVSAYNPATGLVQEVFLEWELVELLVGRKSRSRKNEPVAVTRTSDQRRSTLQTIADQLLSMAMLDRFTSEFALRKLQFYHHMRLLRPQFLSSKWFVDLRQGRKSGAGDEVLRQAACVDGRLVIAVVLENWGDLTFVLYHAASGESYRVTVTLRKIFALLRTKPLMLRLWVCCVKANNYNASLLMFILKHVRFRAYKADGDDGSATASSVSEIAVFEPHLPFTNARKRFQKAMKIQSRKVLLSIAEDAGGGDLEVIAFDWKQNQTYRMLLEREQIRRLLRRTAQASSSSSTCAASSTESGGGGKSARHLLLQKNRRELFEWIASRLAFQSLLEHPQLLAAAHSPLVFGAHIRESFRMFNEWVAGGVRNPLQAVSDARLSRWTAEVDAATFAQLQFDQLALVAETAVPLAYGKEYVGTLDWFAPSSLIASSGRSSTAPAPTESPFMKMDCFVKSHNLFVQLRKELALETEARLERAACVALEAEEKLSMWAEARCALESSSLMFLDWQAREERSRAFVEERAVIVCQLHRELSTRVKCDDPRQGRELVHDVDTLARFVLICEDDDGSKTLTLHKLFEKQRSAFDAEFVSVVVQACSGSLEIASRVLSKCIDHVDSVLKPTLVSLGARVQKAMDQITHVPIDMQRTIWREVLRFRSNAVASAVAEFTVPTAEHPEIVAAAWNPALSHPCRFAENHRLEPASSTCADGNKDAGSLETAVLIPASCEKPMQEVFLGGSIDLDSLVTHLAGMMKTAASSSVRQGKTECEARTIYAKVVHNGLLAYQVAVSSDLDIVGAGGRSTWSRNPRARAIAMEDCEIVGDALYFATRTEDRSLLDRHARITEMARDQAAAMSDPSRSDASQGTRRKLLGTRVKQQLAWKIYASERLQVARSLKRMRAADHVALRTVDSTTESVALATLTLVFRELELLFGTASLTSAGLRGFLPDEISSFVAVCNVKASSDGSVGWKLHTTNPLRMRNVLSEYSVTTVADTGTSGGLRTEHLQVEVDSLEHPRRLIFSCRELQSQRKYFFDCSIRQLEPLLRSKDNTSAIRSLVNSAIATKHELSVADWRRLAQVAAALLVFRKKNGTMGLDFPSSVTTEAAAVLNSDRAPHGSAAHLCSQDRRELGSVMMECLHRRLEKHQRALRAAACRGLMSSRTAHNDKCQLAREWMRMTKEDVLARECRGLLVLDAKELKKLESALASAAKHTKSGSPPSAVPVRGGSMNNQFEGVELRSQLLEITKEFGLTDDRDAAAAEIERSILTMRRAREHLTLASHTKLRGLESQSKAVGSSLSAPATLSETAEWWRRRQCRVKGDAK